MASWFRLFLLKAISTCVLSGGVLSSATVFAEETAPLQIQSEQLIQPEIERRVVELDKIDTEDFEATLFAGLLNIEDFGTNPVYGARFAYHINEDIFIEATYAQSEAGQTSYERISGIPLPIIDDRNVTYYNVSFGYNLLPGESFLTKSLSFNSSIYIVAGVGNTIFAGSDRLTINFGGGFRLLATDWMAVHIDVRNHIFSLNADVLAEEKTLNNLEVTLGLSAFF